MDREILFSLPSVLFYFKNSQIQLDNSKQVGVGWLLAEVHITDHA